MKMHESLGFEGQKQPRNRVRCKFHVSILESSAEPIQIWLKKSSLVSSKQGLFMTEKEARDLIDSLQKSLEELP